MENSINTTENRAAQALGERIRRLRSELGIQQVDMAASLLVHKSHLSKIESGNANPSIRLLADIISKYPVHEAWLLHGEGEMLIKDVGSNEPVDAQEPEEDDERPAIDFTEARKQAGPRIRQMREALGIPAEELVEKFGITTSYLQMLEEGKAQASSTLLGLLIREYGLNHEWLSWGGGPMVCESRQKQREGSAARQEPPAFAHFSDQVYDIELRSMEGMYDIPFDDGFGQVQQMLDILENMGAPKRLTNCLSDAYSNGLANAQRSFYQYGVRDTVAFFLQALEFGSVPLFPREAAELLVKRITRGLEAVTEPDATKQQERGV